MRIGVREPPATGFVPVENPEGMCVCVWVILVHVYYIKLSFCSTIDRSYAVLVGNKVFLRRSERMQSMTRSHSEGAYRLLIMLMTCLLSFYDP